MSVACSSCNGRGYTSGPDETGSYEMCLACEGDGLATSAKTVFVCDRCLATIADLADMPTGPCLSATGVHRMLTVAPRVALHLERLAADPQYQLMIVSHDEEMAIAVVEGDHRTQGFVRGYVDCDGVWWAPTPPTHMFAPLQPPAPDEVF